MSEKTFTIEELREGMQNAFPELEEDGSMTFVEDDVHRLTYSEGEGKEDIEVFLKTYGENATLSVSVHSVESKYEFELNREYILDDSWVNEKLILTEDGELDLGYIFRHFGLECMHQMQKAAPNVRNFFEKPRG